MDAFGRTAVEPHGADEMLPPVGEPRFSGPAPSQVDNVVALEAVPVGGHAYLRAACSGPVLSCGRVALRYDLPAPAERGSICLLVWIDPEGDDPETILAECAGRKEGSLLVRRGRNGFSASRAALKTV